MKHNEDLDILNLDGRIRVLLKKEFANCDKYRRRLCEITKQLTLGTRLRPKIVSDLEADKQTLERKIWFIENIQFYYIEAKVIINEYLLIINTPINVDFETVREEYKGKKPKRAVNSLIVQRRKVVKDYIKVIKTFLSDQILKSVESELLGNFGKADLFETSAIVCRGCGCDNLSQFTRDDDVYVCQLCHEETVKLVSSSSFTDGGRINICNKYSYDRKVHFKDCINQYQGKQNTHVSPKVYEELEEQLINNRIIPPKCDGLSQAKRFKKVTRAHIQLFLKALGYTKHYEDCILIHHTLTGKAPDNIEHLEEKLMVDFDKLTEQYDLLFKDIDRKNFINTQYVLFQLLQKHKYPCNKDDFAVLKTTERKACHDNICKTLFDSLGWDYKFVR